MDHNMDRECNALGDLFQHIVNDMKGSSIIWEDFLCKAAKLHTALKATIVAAGAFLEAFQRVADMATNTRGATKEIGSALTRLCMRHKSIEDKLKVFTCGIMDIMVTPMSDRIEEWKKSVMQLDKDHAKESKRARQEIKRASSDTVRLQKKVKKGKSDCSVHLERAMQDINEKYVFLQETEKNAVRKALIEERRRYCLFISCVKPLVDREISMLGEITHLQEILDSLCMQAGDMNSLPAASEQVIQDIKGSDPNTWSFQQQHSSPPSSPSSLGSRKSSMCSISSIASSSSGSTKSHSPSHQLRHRNTSQPPPTAVRLSSVSSQDSGFTSQDTLYPKASTPPLDYHKQSSLQGSSSGSSTGDSSATTPSPSYPASSTSVSTWSNWPDPPNFPRHEPPGGGALMDRPHTISSAYERSHGRPALTAQTFEPPEMPEKQPLPQTAPTSPSPYAVPCIVPQGTRSRDSWGPGSDRPPPTGPKPPPQPRGRPVALPTVPDFNLPNADQCKKLNVMPQPTYVNMNELATMAAQKGAAQKGVEKVAQAIAEEDPAKLQEDGSDDFVQMRGAGGGSAPRPHRSISMPPQAPNTLELADAIKELEMSTAALQMNYHHPAGPSRQSLPCSSGYGTMNSSPSCSESTIASESSDEQNNCPGNRDGVPRLQHQHQSTTADAGLASYHGSLDKFSAILRNGDSSQMCRSSTVPRRPASTAGLPVVNSGTATIRRSSMQMGRPQPPVRRATSMAGGVMVVPPTIPTDEARGAESSPQGTPPRHRRSHSDASSDSSSSLVDTPQPAVFDLNSSGEDLPLPPPPDDLAFAADTPTDPSDTTPVGEVPNGSMMFDGPTPQAEQPPAGTAFSLSNPRIIHSLSEKLEQRRRQSEGESVSAAIEAIESSKRDSTESLDSEDITPTGDPPQDSLMLQIIRGVHLRKTVCNDRSAPRFT